MKLKVCGLTDKFNILSVAGLHPDYLGFIFYKGSKRYVGDDFRMPEIPSGIRKTGVFVNADAQEIIEKVTKYHLDAVQLHGVESPELCAGIGRLVTVIKAFGVDEDFDFDSLNAYKDVCQYFLFDTKSKEHGGSGKKFDWNILNDYKLEIPFFLSGGIGIAELSEISFSPLKKRVYCIDVNSRFETIPGIKNIEQLADAKLMINKNF